MTALNVLTLPPAATEVLVHLVRAQNVARLTGADSLAKKKEIAEVLGKRPSSIHSALGALAAQGLVTDTGGPVQLRVDSPLLPTVYDLVFIAEGEPLPPDIADATWLHPQEHTVDKTAHVPVPYTDEAPAEVASDPCGPTLEAARRVLLDEWRALIAARPTLSAVRALYGHRSEHGDAHEVLNDLVQAAAWLLRATTKLASSDDRERLTGHEWAIHEILLDKAIINTRTYGDGWEPLLGLSKALWTLAESQPDERGFRRWMHQNLKYPLP